MKETIAAWLKSHLINPQAFDGEALCDILAARIGNPQTPLRESLGLSVDDFSELIGFYFRTLPSLWNPQELCFKLFVHRALRLPFHCLVCGKAVDEKGLLTQKSKPLPIEEKPAWVETKAELQALFAEHESPHPMTKIWGKIIISACQSSHHLWEDLGVKNRTILSQLLAHYFPSLYAKNHSNMRWKKFFFRMLCEKEGVYLCKSPNCASCAEYAICFVQEE
jgi:nitrogen fixation protein NifQ